LELLQVWVGAFRTRRKDGYRDGPDTNRVQWGTILSKRDASVTHGRRGGKIGGVVRPGVLRETAYERVLALKNKKGGRLKK